MALRVLVDHSRITPSLEPDAKKLSGGYTESHNYSSRFTAFIVSYTAPLTEHKRHAMCYTIVIGSASNRK